MTRERLNSIINALITMRDAVDDTIALSAKDLYPDWREDAHYTTGDRVRYADTLYKCLQSHTAQPTWTPANATVAVYGRSRSGYYIYVPQLTIVQTA